MKKNFLNYLLNTVIIILIAVVGYLTFSLVTNSVKSNKPNVQITDTNKVTNQPNLTAQVDVQNGTNEQGVASKFTEYLRKKGYDVVEMGNSKYKDMEKTTIIDRKGDKKIASSVAAALGVSENNISQQVNKSLYLDVTVVIGKDFKNLKPYLEKNK
jgi:calcineurin-like phosphoesterase